MAVIMAALSFHKHRITQVINQERKKYEKTCLDSDKAGFYLKKLLLLMKTEKPYLNSQLNLKMLSQKLSMKSHHLSQIINEKQNG